MSGLGKLIVMLGNGSSDGEVINAARLLGRAMERSGKDWFWLAQLADAGAAEPASRQLHEDIEDHQQRAQWLLDDHDQRLRGKDRDFLDRMLNWPGMPTGRQRAWLDDLCRRYGYRP